MKISGIVRTTKLWEIGGESQQSDDKKCCVKLCGVICVKQRIMVSLLDVSKLKLFGNSLKLYCSSIRFNRLS